VKLEAPETNKIARDSYPDIAARSSEWPGKEGNRAFLYPEYKITRIAVPKQIITRIQFLVRWFG
jgi:hypothetical protein